MAGLAISDTPTKISVASTPNPAASPAASCQTAFEDLALRAADNAFDRDADGVTFETAGTRGAPHAGQANLNSGCGSGRTMTPQNGHLCCSPRVAPHEEQRSASAAISAAQTGQDPAAFAAVSSLVVMVFLVERIELVAPREGAANCGGANLPLRSGLFMTSSTRFAPI